MKNNSIFLPQAQNAIIDSWGLKEKPSEFVWILFGDDEPVARERNLVQDSSFEQCSARTLEELLSLLPAFSLLTKCRKRWGCEHKYIGCEDYHRIIHKDPKQAVFQMLEWCVEQGYLKPIS